MKEITYTTSGTCSRQINIKVDDEGRIADVSFEGGCNGNLKGLCSLVKGMKADEVKEKLRGITCGTKPTSCPDQFARALEQL
mgnify:FL=1